MSFSTFLVRCLFEGRFQSSAKNNESIPMNSQIFVNLPVADLPKSRAFFKALECPA